ncbi:MAG TPA: type II toxin-antitoxin system prevent-host-death family antitoxin, partial [Candidatus Dormibacteraeota bacterium]|nr:type II toxin-antitoxin system prevent-host-death family antitoxin [Candidatus Dormibacteraeota bacterium]
MKSIGLFEAKTHLSALVESARQGHETVITVRGRPAARIVPIVDEAGRDAVSFLLANTSPMGMPIR